MPPVNGSMLAELASAYVAALNDNAAPTISTAWDRVVDRQCTVRPQCAGAACTCAALFVLVIAASVSKGLHMLQWGPDKYACQFHAYFL